MSSNTKKLSRFDMVQFEFSDEKLDMSFLYDYVSRSHKEDPMIKVLTEDIYFEGEKCSNICMIDPSNDTLHVGMAEAGSMPYQLHHDFAGVNAIFSFCQDNRYMYGNVSFPDVPIAKSPFPPNQYYRPCEGYDLEYILCRKGFKLLNVTVGCYKAMSKAFPIYTSEGLIGMELKDDEGYYFTPYMDNMIDKNVLGMQFNPFHPMAIKMIRTAEWNGNILKGTYEYRTHVIPFSYDLEDRRYRIYSEDWRQILPEISGYLEVFDFVAFFPINDLLNLKERRYHIEPFVVEPLLILASSINYPYSKIGPTLISVSRGVGDVISLPYSRFEIESSLSSVHYEEITSCCKLYVGDRLEYNGRIINFRKDVLQSDTIFVRVVCRDDEFRFRAFCACEGGSFRFLEVPDIYFNSFPRNVWGSIIYPYNCQTLVDIYKCGDIVHEFLPMYVSIDDSLELNYEYEDVLVEDEKLKVDDDCLDRSSFFYQGYLTQQPHHYSTFCKICRRAIDSDAKSYSDKEVLSWVHKECWMCYCGEVDKVYYNPESNRFQCNVANKCSYLRECYVCKKHVDYTGFFYEYYVHRECIDCSCGLYIKPSLIEARIACICEKKKNYHTVNSRNKDIRTII